MEKGDALGHEFMGVVEEAGLSVSLGAAESDSAGLPRITGSAASQLHARIESNCTWSYPLKTQCRDTTAHAAEQRSKRYQPRFI
jgi:hypothetical protein